MIGKREFIILQALAFIDYASKPGAQPFAVWMESKEFADDDKEAIGVWVEIILNELNARMESPTVNNHSCIVAETLTQTS
jgi:hypothetical protein